MCLDVQMLQALKKQLPPPPKATLTADAASHPTHDAAGNPYISSEQYVMQDEILKVGGHHYVTINSCRILAKANT